MSEHFGRRRCVRQLGCLLGGRVVRPAEPAVEQPLFREDTSVLGTLCRAAGAPLSPAQTIMLSLLCGLATAGVSLRLVALPVVPVPTLIGSLQPLWWLDRRAKSRAARFSADYPAVLMATSSSLKAGLTPYQALERATRLLPETSPVRTEITAMLRRIDLGIPRDIAVHRFAETLRQPEVTLFRSAFLLALEHGGRFAPTLSRLAAVSHARETLIESARVSTASMRMTADLLVVIAPLLVLFMAARAEGYWQTLATDPIANALGSLGGLIMCTCYGLLRRMSAFQP